MQNQKSNKLLRANPSKIISIFAILFVIFEFILFISIENFGDKKLDISFYIYTTVLLIATVVICILSITSTSYEIDSNKLVHHKMGKTNEFFWNDILYIDEAFSEKHKMMLFYTKDGRENYLMFDKEWKIYETALSKVRQISLEEMKRRFPNKKL